MDFFEHQERARKKTGLLVVYFVLAVIAIIVAVYLAVAGVLFYGQSSGGPGSGDTLWFPDVFAAVSLATVAVVAVGSLYKITELSSGGEGVARSLGGRQVPSNTTDLRERVLLNVVEEMAIASGTPVPPVFLLDHESAINAFAAGTTPQNAVIGITRGAVETLKRDELQGVIAHEFSHILNGDMRLNLRLMGLLNGILLIAMIGYFLMRTSSRSSYLSSEGEKKGGNPLPFLGLLLYIIGYVGIFFGNLIKSAVSRQREFLADASAVQFTRLPDGIKNALIKIGGLVYGSRLQAAAAEEASHMFFGNGVRQPFLDLLATHPPLDVRIRRIDPNFAGVFPAVTQVTYTTADLADPHTLAMRRQEAAAVHVAAFAGAQSLETRPQRAVAQVGQPRPAHIDYATGMLGSLPPELERTLRDPLGAIAVIYALLLDDKRPAVRQTQLDYLATRADPRARDETLRIAGITAQLPPEAKLPLVSMVLPPLKALSPAQLAGFRDDVEFLMRVDEHVTLFEYAVRRLVLKRLLPRLDRASSPSRVNSMEPLVPACNGLLSTLAYSGTRNQAQAARAFELSVDRLPRCKGSYALLARDEAGLRTIDRALDQLALASPAIKKRVLEGCAACIVADRKVTIEEGELLRIISDALDCPMPPLLSDV